MRRTALALANGPKSRERPPGLPSSGLWARTNFRRGKDSAVSIRSIRKDLSSLSRTLCGGLCCLMSVSSSSRASCSVRVTIVSTRAASSTRNGT